MKKECMNMQQKEQDVEIWPDRIRQLRDRDRLETSE